MATGAVVARILTQYSDKGSKAAQKDIAKLGKRIDAFGKKAAKSFAIATAASAAFAVKIGTDAVKAAIEENRTQQVLANTLRNVAGATDATIKKVDEYIDAQEMLSTVSDTELRASFGRLVAISGDVTEAMRIQTVALDVAAGTTKDLSTVSAAFEKASAGNFTALKKILPGINANIIKNKDLGAALAYATEMYGGSAEAFGDTEPLKRLSIAYGRVLETLGGALLPKVIEFTEYLTKPGGLLDSLDKWVKVNEEELQESLKGVTDLFKILIDNSGNLTKTLNLLVQISGFLNTSILGIIKWGEALFGIFVIARLGAGINKIFGGINKEVLIGGRRFDVAYKSAGKLGGVLSKFGVFGKIAAAGIGSINLALIALRSTAIGAAIALAFATAGVSLGTASLALAGIGIAAVTAKLVMGDYTKETKKATAASFDLAKQEYGGAAAVKFEAEQEAARAKARAIQRAADAKAAAAALAQEKKDAALKAAIAKGQALLAKFGVKTAENDPIQLEAARLNLVKQGNLAEAARIAMMGKNLELQLEANKALARYNDLLGVLADKTISSEEVFLLSKKWGMTIEATQSYIQTLLAVADQTISDDEITNLAKAWGVSKEKAGMYLDFFTYLNDGKLSDAEIAKLQSKWGLTSKEVGIYADLITKASDYVLSDKEIEDLKKNWGLTTDEVVAYIRKLGQPVTFSGTLIDPATQATLGWKNALAALQAYLAALAGKGIAGVVPVVPGGKPIVPNPIVPGYGSSKDEKEEAAAAATTSGGNLIKALEEIASATSTSSINAAVAAATEIGATASEIANSMVTGLLEQGVSTQNALSTARYTGQAIAAQQQAEQEAAERALRNQQYAEGMAKRYGGFVGSSTIDNAKGLTGSSSGTASNITINVAGSVTSEQDLVQTIRSGLLRGQYNGQALALELI